MYDFDSFKNRLNKNLKQLKKWVSQYQLEAYRIYDKDIPQFPLAIDIYGQKIHVQEYDTGWQMTEEEYGDWLSKVSDSICLVTCLDKESIYYKLRQKQKGKQQYEKRHNPGEDFLIKEHGNIFLINLEKYLDSGLFLDHRPMRKYVGENSLGKRFLNLFCYTSSFTVYAAKGGAVYSESVDLSNTYLDWSQKNFFLNQIPVDFHHLIREDVFCYLQNAVELQKKFDLIVLDPPSFSNSKKMKHILDIQKDHVWLIKQSMQLLDKNGVLIFSNNLRNFQLDWNIQNKFNVFDKTKVSIPKDFRNQKIHHCWWMTHKN